ncbi:MAG: divergent PAP2 family protein [Candidatus Omnitrophica bacterium]|nr:divergent PAP2 family protein [Candidatus Omnitrophota bacterium]
MNKIMDDIYWQGKTKESRLRELIGHTPIEVIAGSLIGIAIAYIMQ